MVRESDIKPIVSQMFEGNKETDDCLNYYCISKLHFSISSNSAPGAMRATAEETGLQSGSTKDLNASPNLQAACLLWK